jgi:two-component system nitrate/nitrite response regulator NarL
MGDGKVRVTVVDRHELYVRVLASSLERHGYRVRGVATTQLTSKAVVRLVARTRPDVVLAAVSLGGADGVDVLERLRRDGHRVVAIVDRPEPLPLGQALAAGSHGVVAKSSSLEVLLDVVGKMVREEPVIEDARRAELIRTYDAVVGVHALRVARLTRQERELLAHMMEGHTVAEVARVRCVSEGTVRTQVKSVLAKLEVSSQLSAVAVGRGAGCTPATLHIQGPSGATS